MCMGHMAAAAASMHVHVDNYCKSISGMVIGARGARACDMCGKERARWYCAADEAYLCETCDASVHSANSVARRHERVRLGHSNHSAMNSHDGKPRARKSSATSSADHDRLLHDADGGKRLKNGSFEGLPDMWHDDVDLVHHSHSPLGDQQLTMMQSPCGDEQLVPCNTKKRKKKKKKKKKSKKKKTEKPTAMAGCTNSSSKTSSWLRSKKRSPRCISGKVLPATSQSVYGAYPSVMIGLTDNRAAPASSLQSEDDQYCHMYSTRSSLAIAPATAMTCSSKSVKAKEAEACAAWGRPHSSPLTSCTAAAASCCMQQYWDVRDEEAAKEDNPESATALIADLQLHVDPELLQGLDLQMPSSVSMNSDPACGCVNRAALPIPHPAAGVYNAASCPPNGKDKGFDPPTSTCISFKNQLPQSSGASQQQLTAWVDTIDIKMESSGGSLESISPIDDSDDIDTFDVMDLCSNGASFEDDINCRNVDLQEGRLSASCANMDMTWTQGSSYIGAESSWNDYVGCTNIFEEAVTAGHPLIIKGANATTTTSTHPGHVHVLKMEEVDDEDDSLGGVSCRFDFVDDGEGGEADHMNALIIGHEHQPAAGAMKLKLPSLRLNYDDIRMAWSDDKGSLWTDGQRPQTVPDILFHNIHKHPHAVEYYYVAGTSHYHGTKSTSTSPPCSSTQTELVATAAAAQVPVLNVQLRHMSSTSSSSSSSIDHTQGAAAAAGGREARVLRYREKRRTRLFSKRIRYEVRKLNAERRPRMKGRFVKRSAIAGIIT